MRTITLARGKGDGKSTACLMTAASIVNGDKVITDSSSCICQIIGKFIILTNDSMSDDIRNELYTPLIWEIIGTVTTDIKHIIQRANIVARYANKFSVIASAAACSYASSRSAARCAARSSDHASSAAVSADISAAFSAPYAAAVSYAAIAASYAAHAAHAADTSICGAYAPDAYIVKEKEIWQLCVDCIREMIAVDPHPVEKECMQYDELAEMLGT